MADTIDDIVATFDELSDKGLAALADRESAGDDRKGLLDAIAKEQKLRAEAAKAEHDARELALAQAQAEATSKAPAQVVVTSANTVARTGAVDAKIASAAVKSAHGEPKTYIALQAGTDHKQGLIPAGARFTTTQPQGSWMEPVED